MRTFNVGDIVQHFKRGSRPPKDTTYLYKILAFAEHTESGETLVIYQALYPTVRDGNVTFEVYARPIKMFLSPVDARKYPNCKQKHRFEKYDKTNYWRDVR